MKMRKPVTHVISPPARRKAGTLWLAAAALLANTGIAAWTIAGHHSAPSLFPASWAANTPNNTLDRQTANGQATWYGAELHGQATASGEPFDMYGLTAAHRTLPLGSSARITNLANGRQVVVRINDRGPGRPGVMIDLSYGAAQAIGLLGSGPVEVAPLR
jgi:rare lipoprotein A (peptidoglycan hydrolase)